MTGIQVAHELSRQRPDVRTLMLSMHDNEQYYYEALKVGAAGYVLKSAANRDLIEGCRAALRGSAFVYPPAAQAWARDATGPGRLPARSSRAGRSAARARRVDRLHGRERPDRGAAGLGLPVALDAGHSAAAPWR
jgi:DNA-binding NarL/FixJ family response regulator